MQNKRIVVKVGTSTITHETGHINIHKLEQICQVISDLINEGHNVLLVSSGATGVGSSKLGLLERPVKTAQRQAVAAVGQCELMLLYRKLFADFSYNVAQLLLTRDVTDNEITKLNVVNTVETLFDMNIIPVVNENDTVSTAELSGSNFGDNDMLSAIVSSIVRADMLIILTDTDGLFTSDPRRDRSAVRIPVVEDIDDDIVRIATGSVSNRGTGGMASKVGAASLATSNGITTFIINGQFPEHIYDILSDKDVGTRFMAKP